MMSMLPPGELGCDAGRRIRTGRAWRDQCVAASTRGASRYVFTCSSIWLAATRSLTDPLFSVLDGFRVILNSQRTIDESFYSSFYLDLFVFLFDVLLFAFYFLICRLAPPPLGRATARTAAAYHWRIASRLIDNGIASRLMDNGVASHPRRSAPAVLDSCSARSFPSCRPGLLGLLEQLPRLRDRYRLIALRKIYRHNNAH